MNKGPRVGQSQASLASAGATPTLAQVLAAGNDGGGLQIRNIANPSASQDAVTEPYVTSQINAVLAYVASLGALRTKTVRLTDADLRALPTTPFALAPAPGAGFFTCVIAIARTWDTTNGAYTNIDNLNGVGVTYGTVFSGSIPQIDNIGAVIETQTTTPQAGQLCVISNFGAGQVIEFDLTGVENVAVNVLADNGTDGDFTGGDPANYLTYTVVYMTLPVT